MRRRKGIRGENGEKKEWKKGGRVDVMKTTTGVRQNTGGKGGREGK